MADQVDTRGLADGNVQVFSDGTVKQKHGWGWIIVSVLGLGVAGLGAALHEMVVIGIGLLALGLCLVVFRKAFAEPSGLFRNYENPIEWSDDPGRRRATVMVLGVLAIGGGIAAIIASFG